MLCYCRKHSSLCCTLLRDLCILLYVYPSIPFFICLSVHLMMDQWLSFYYFAFILSIYFALLLFLFENVVMMSCYANMKGEFSQLIGLQWNLRIMLVCWALICPQIPFEFTLVFFPFVVLRCWYDDLYHVRKSLSADWAPMKFSSYAWLLSLNLLSNSSWIILTIIKSLWKPKFIVLSLFILHWTFVYRHPFFCRLWLIESNVVEWSI